MHPIISGTPIKNDLNTWGDFKMGTVAILNMVEIIKKYDTKTFLETGTLHGDAVELASR